MNAFTETAAGFRKADGSCVTVAELGYVFRLLADAATLHQAKEQGLELFPNPN